MRLPASLALLVLIPACGGDSSPGAASPESGTLDGSQAPSIRIVTPGPRTRCHPGATINVHAVAIDPDTSIFRVDFFDGTELVGTRWSAPFIIAWGGVAEGTHLLTAVATDVDGLTAVSAPVTVIVSDDDDDDDQDDRHRRRRR